MMIELKNLKEKYNLNLKGVIHIGAHWGTEQSVYEELDIKNKMFFEPVQSTFNILKEKVGDRAVLINKAVGNENKKITMNIETANGGQSSSILNPKLHLYHYPHIQFHHIEEVDMVRLDDYVQNKEEYNFLNIDVQGYELEVLKGAKDFLNTVDYIMTEINNAELYENCALVDDIIAFLSPYGFKLVETNWSPDGWGDGFFIKQK
jgi:FkbM family methyltransferase